MRLILCLLLVAGTLPALFSPPDARAASLADLSVTRLTLSRPGQEPGKPLFLDFQIANTGSP